MRRGGRAEIAMALIGVVILAAACSSSATNSAAPETTNPRFTYHPSDIALLRDALSGEKPGNGAAMGTSYVSTGLTVDGAPQPFVDGRHMSVSFYGGRFSATIHCANLVEGAYEITDDGHLDLSDLDRDAAMRASLGPVGNAGCQRTATMEQAAAQDSALTQMLVASPTVSLLNGALTLAGDGTTVAMIDSAAAPVLPLVGTTWIGSDIAYGRTFHPLGGPDAVTLVFDDAGKVAITFGCNDGGARYAVNGGSITFSGYHLSSRDCPGPTADALSGGVPDPATVTDELKLLFTLPATFTLSPGGLQVGGPGLGHTSGDTIGLDLEGT